MSGKLKNRVAVVTGSGSGIGEAVAMAMAQEGAKVVTNNRQPGNPAGDAELTAKAIRDMGGQAVPFFGDIGEPEKARKLINTAVDKFGRIDILVNMAGIDMRGMIWETTEEDFDNIMRIHVKGTYNCIRHACGIMMKQKWGRIINTSSLVWLRNQDYSLYGTAKAAIIGLTKTVAMDLRGYGITCNAIAPIARSRITGTPESIAHFTKMYEDGLITKKYYEMSTNPPDPATVPPLLLYLCTEEATNITGHLFRIIGQRISDCWLPLNRTTIYKPEGTWTMEELAKQVPEVLMEGYVDPVTL